MLTGIRQRGVYFFGALRKTLVSQVQNLPIVVAHLWGVFIFLLSFTAGAGPVTDPRAPIEFRSTIHNAANGVPVINIAKPDSRGLSHNQYSLFDVDADGAVLNNASATGRSALAGVLNANPNLTSGGASIILNEVTSLERSQLLGNLEVFGQRADVIIANPNGITCNGCSFLHALRVSLTTGVPVLGVYGLGFQVRQGDIQIGRKGLHGVDGGNYSVELLANNVSIDGSIDASSNVAVVAGQFDLDYTGSHPADHSAALAPYVHPVSGANSNGALAIDASRYGAMQSGQIEVIATTQGAGVKLDGALTADANDLLISAKGDVQFSSASSGHDVTINANNVQQNGDVKAAEHVTLNANRYTATGAITAAGDINATLAQANLNQVTAGRDATLNATAAHLNQAVSAARNLEVNAANLTMSNTASADAGGKLNIKAQQAQLANISAGQDLVANIEGNLTLSGNNGSGGDTTLNAQQINQTNGRVYSSGNVTLTAQQGINTQADFAAKNIHFKTAGASDITHHGLLWADDNVWLEGNNVTLADGRAGAAHLNFAAQNTLSIQNSLLSSVNPLHLSGFDIQLDNNTGLYSDSALAFNVAGHFNSNAEILAPNLNFTAQQGIQLGQFSQLHAADIQLNSAQTIQQGGSVDAATKASLGTANVGWANYTATSSNWTNTGALYTAAFAVSAPQINNSGYVEATHAAFNASNTFSNAGIFYNHDVDGANVSVSTPGVFSNSGVWDAKEFTSTFATLSNSAFNETNHNGTLQIRGNWQANGLADITNAGHIQLLNPQTFNLQQLSNNGEISSAQDLTITAATYQSHGGNLIGYQNLNLSAGHFDLGMNADATQLAQIQAVGNLTASTAGLLESNGTNWTTNSALSITADQLHVNQGSISAPQAELHLNPQTSATPALVLTDSQWVSNTRADVFANAIVLNNSSVNSGATHLTLDRALSSPGLQLNNSKWIANELTVTASQLALDANSLLAGATHTYNLSGDVNNAGKIDPDQLTLNAANFINSGELWPLSPDQTSNVALTGNFHNTSTGSLGSNHDLTLNLNNHDFINEGATSVAGSFVVQNANQFSTATLIRANQASIQTQALTLQNATPISGQAGAIATDTGFTLTTNLLAIQPGTFLYSLGDLTVNTTRGGLTNDGQLISTGKMDLNLAGDLINERPVVPVDPHDGVILSGGAMTVNAASIINRHGALFGLSNMALTGRNAITNTSGVINVNGDLALNTPHFLNQSDSPLTPVYQIDPANDLANYYMPPDIQAMVARVNHFSEFTPAELNRLREWIAADHHTYDHALDRYFVYLDLSDFTSQGDHSIDVYMATLMDRGNRRLNGAMVSAQGTINFNGGNFENYSSSVSAGNNFTLTTNGLTNGSVDETVQRIELRMSKDNAIDVSGSDKDGKRDVLLAALKAMYQLTPEHMDLTRYDQANAAMNLTPTCVDGVCVFHVWEIQGPAVASNTTANLFAGNVLNITASQTNNVGVLEANQLIINTHATASGNGSAAPSSGVRQSDYLKNIAALTQEGANVATITAGTVQNGLPSNNPQGWYRPPVPNRIDLSQYYNPNVSLPPLITDPRYTTLFPGVKTEQFNFDASALFAALGLTIPSDLSFFADPLLEQYLLAQAALAESGRRYFVSAANTDSQQQKELFDNTVAFAKAHNLQVGQLLTPDQVAALTAPILWYEKKIIDGAAKLVPVVYLSEVDQTSLATLGTGDMVANDIQITTPNNLINTGRIQAQHTLSINADSVINQRRVAQAPGSANQWLQSGGEIEGRDVFIQTQADLTNQGGWIASTASDDESGKAKTNLIQAAALEKAGKTEEAQALLGYVPGRLQLQVGGNFYNEAVRSQTEFNLGDNGGVGVKPEYQAGEIASASVLLADIKGHALNKGSTLVSDGDLQLTAARIENRSIQEVYLAHRDKDEGRFSSSKSESEAVVQAAAAIGGSGNTRLTSKGDILNHGAQLGAGNTLALDAKGNLVLEGDSATAHHSASSSGFSGLNYNKSSGKGSDDSVLLSELSANDIQLNAGDSINGSGVQAHALNNVSADAANDIQFNATEAQHANTSKSSGIGITGKLSLPTLYSKNSDYQGEWTDGSVTSLSAGNNLTLRAGRDVKLVDGTQLLAAQALTDQQKADAANDLNAEQTGTPQGLVAIQAGRNIELGAYSNNVEERSHRSGLDSFGYNRTDTQTNAGPSKQQQAAVLSGENLYLRAGQGLNATTVDPTSNGSIHGQGVQLIAEHSIDAKAANDIDFGAQQDLLYQKTYGQNVNVSVAGIDVTAYANAKTDQERKQLLANQSPLLGALNRLHNAEQAGESQNKKENAMVAAYYGAQLYKMGATSFSGVASVTGIDVGRGVSIHAGTSESKSTWTSSQNSQLSAGDDIRLNAGHDLTLTGVSATAGENISFHADHDLTLTATADTNDSNSKGHGATVGFNGGVYGGMDANRSTQDGTTYTNTHLNAKNVSTQSGNDTTLKGAVITAQTADLSAGNNLTIESLQDHSKLNAENGSFTVGSYQSVNVRQTKGNRKAVGEQSGIYTDGKLRITTQNHTQLTGGAIVSKNNDLILDTGTLGYSDIKNEDNYQTASVGWSQNAQAVGENKTAEANKTAPTSANPLAVNSTTSKAALNGDSSGTGGFYEKSEENTTYATVGGGQIIVRSQNQQKQNVADINRDTSKSFKSLDQAYDANSARPEIAKIIAQQSFAYVGDIAQNKQIDKDIAKNKVKTAEANYEQATASGDMGAALNAYKDLQAAQSDLTTATDAANAWAEGSFNKTATHAIAGGLSILAGGGNVAAGMVSAGSAEFVRGYTQDQSKAVQYGASLVTGAIAATTTGGGANTALQGGMVGLAGEQYNRNLHKKEIEWIKANKDKFAASLNISPEEAEARLGQQAYRQVQFGTEGHEDADARTFLQNAGYTYLAADPSHPDLGGTRMFAADTYQRKNTELYGDTRTSFADFYAKNGLANVSVIDAQAANDHYWLQTKQDARNALQLGAGSFALASGVATLPAIVEGIATGCSANPLLCANEISIAAGEIGAGEALPTGLGIGLMSNSGKKVDAIESSMPNINPDYLPEGIAAASNKELDYYPSKIDVPKPPLSIGALNNTLSAPESTLIKDNFSVELNANYLAEVKGGINDPDFFLTPSKYAPVYGNTKMTMVEGEVGGLSNSGFAGADSEINNVWHSTGNASAVRNILDKGIDPNYLNANSRFGKAFYVAEQPSTSLAEMSHYGIDPSTGIRFSIQTEDLKILDLTNPLVAQQWGYTGGDKTLQMQQLGEQAKARGFNAIRFYSEREAGGVNIAVLSDFNKVLKPEMVTPVPK